MSKDAKNYQIAKEAQDVFRDAIKNSMEGNIAELKKLVKDFLDKNPTYSSEDFFTGFQSEGRTLLHIAASCGKYEIFEYVVGECKAIKSFVDLKDQKGFTPLMNATIAENDPTIEKLLSLGADVNMRNNDGVASIHFAASDGAVARMKRLCDAGAQLDQMSQSGSPLHWAAGKGRSAAIEFIVHQVGEFSRAISEDADHAAAQLRFINAPNKEGMSAVLMAAVASCDLGVSYLVEAGADIGAIISGNLTTLHICAEHGLVQAVRSIIKTETGLKCCKLQTDEGNAPIHLAAMAKYRDVVKVLVPHSDLSSIASLGGAGTVFTAEAVTDAVVDKIMEDGAKRMEQWEAHHQSKMAKAEAEKQPQTELHKIAGEATSAADVTPAMEDAAEKFKDSGNAHYKAGRYEAAKGDYTEALYLNKFNATYWSNRSACYLALKDPTKALQDAEICRHLNPTWPRGCYRLAAARLALHQYEDAAVAAFEGVKLDENNAELKALLQTAVKKGQDEHKEKLLREQSQQKQQQPKP
jgi:ankyrin repeat protein